MKLADAFSAFLPLIESEMRSLLAAEDPETALHYGMMQYHMGWVDDTMKAASAPTGKRVRPMLCVLSCGSAGGDPKAAMPAGAGLELLHNFSLIHDDIEDDSATRRHRPTLWKQFGLPLACNAGDGMFSLAHLAFFRLDRAGATAQQILGALRVFDETCLALTEGQYMDMSFESRQQVTVGEYFQMIRGKTGALFAASTEIGALVAGAAPDLVQLYREYGAALGRAFQLRDDVLGIWGDESVIGKPADSDILSKKKSLPVLHAMADPVVGEQLINLYAGPSFTGTDVSRVLDLLNRAGSRAYVEAEVMAATAEAHRALGALAAHSDPAYLAALREMLDALAARRS